VGLKVGEEDVDALIAGELVDGVGARLLEEVGLVEGLEEFVVGEPVLGAYVGLRVGEEDVDALIAGELVDGVGARLLEEVGLVEGLEEFTVGEPAVGA